MTNSGSAKPDLDWSQVRETIKMLALSAAQVESGMKLGDESVNLLTGSFTGMVDDMSAIHDVLVHLEPSPERDNALERCHVTQERIYASIVAFQFYDRLQQCLGHISTGLKSLSSLIENPHRLYNPEEWYKLQMEIRSHYTMESEKAMFDAILAGKSIEEALALAEQSASSGGDTEIEFF